MAKRTLQEEVIREKAMREGLDKMIEKEKAILALNTVGPNITNAELSPVIMNGGVVTKSMMEGFVAEQQSKRFQAEQEESIRRKWLDDTQNMRVVALNEACGVVKSMMDNNDQLSVDPKLITAYARAFADFLVEGRS